MTSRHGCVMPIGMPGAARTAGLSNILPEHKVEFGICQLEFHRCFPNDNRIVLTGPNYGRINAFFMMRRAKENTII